MPHPHLATRRVALTAVAALVTAGAVGCGSAPDDGSPADARSATISLEDGWVKAVDAATSDPMPMTAMFGTLHNPTDEDVTVTGGSSPVAAVVELHEVVRDASGQMQMREKPGGFVIAANGDHLLQPGGDHVMLLDLEESLDSGTQVTVTLETSVGTVDLTVPVRTFAGAEESYVPEAEPSAS